MVDYKGVRWILFLCTIVIIVTDNGFSSHTALVEIIFENVYTRTKLPKFSSIMHV